MYFITSLKRERITFQAVRKHLEMFIGDPQHIVIKCNSI